MKRLLALLIFALVIGSMAVSAQGRNAPYAMTIDIQSTSDPLTYKVIATLYDYYARSVGQGYSIGFMSDTGYVYPDFVETDRYGQSTAYLYLEQDWFDEVFVVATYTDPQALYIISTNTTVKLR